MPLSRRPHQQSEKFFYSSLRMIVFVNSLDFNFVMLSRSATKTERQRNKKYQMSSTHEKFN